MPVPRLPEPIPPAAPTVADLERNRRASARAALYLALVVVAAAGGAAWTWLGAALEVRGRAFDWIDVDYQALPAVQELQRLVAIDSSVPEGLAAAAGFLATRLRAAGVEPVIERVGDGEAVNLWAVLEGDDPRAVVLHQHLDVEPVPDPSAWRYPPFAAQIEGPWLYGRGAFDMKSLGIAQLEAFVRLAAAGRRPARSVILLATSGEETGSRLGMRWVLARHPELVERFTVVLTEGGAVEGRTPEDVKYWGVEFAQKRLVEVTVCGGDRERLEELRAELIDSGRPLDRLRLTPEVAAFLRVYAPTRDREDLRRLLADPAGLLRDLPTFDDQPAYLKAMFRDESVPFPVVAADGGGWELRVLFHLLPGSRPETAIAHLLPPWRRHGLEVAVYDEGGAGHGSPPDHPLLSAVERVVHRRYPGVPTGPLFLPWTATDSRFVRARGIPSYGVSPFMILTPEVTTQAQSGTVNERIALPGFVEGVELYAELVELLAGEVDGD
jgi:acetylornithine deacetylase/succinyl-diaminopimelate desuccinylase-like protein